MPTRFWMSHLTALPNNAKSYGELACDYHPNTPLGNAQMYFPCGLVENAILDLKFLIF